jgi:hypothetical protein
VLLEVEHDNLRASLGWSLEHDHAIATNLAGLLGRFWNLREYLAEGRLWLEAAINNDVAEQSDRARVLYHLASLSAFQSDYHVANAWATEALRLFREAGHSAGTAMSLIVFGVVAFREEEYDRAIGLLQESLMSSRSESTESGPGSNR